MSSEYLHLIDVVDGDPIQVTKHSNAGGGLQFSEGGVVTTIPWSQVTRIRRVDVADLRACAAGDDVSDAVKAFYADLDTDCVDLGAEVPRDQDTAPEGGRTTGEMAGDAPAATQAAEPAPAGDTDPKTGAGRARETGGDPSAKELRDWAEKNSIDVPKSGPVPDSVKSAYAAAHTD